MQEFLSREFYRNTVQEWFITLGIILITIFFAKFTYRVLSKLLSIVTKKTKTKIDDEILEGIEGPMVLGILLGGFSIAIYRLFLSVRAEEIITNIYKLVIVLNIAWLLIRVFDIILKAYLEKYSRRSDIRLNAELIPLLRRVTRIILWLFGIVIGLNNAGQDVAALITGLGIGGLAVALAAQDTMKNIFGGIMIFVDKPFRISERIVIEGIDGHVENIGMRTTRIKTTSGRLVTIPNMKFTDKPIENISRRREKRIELMLSLYSETTIEQMKLAENILYKLAEEHEDVDQNKAFVYFSAFGDYDLQITFVYTLKRSGDQFIQEGMMNHRVLEEFRKAKIPFSTPTSIVQLEKSDDEETPDENEEIQNQDEQTQNENPES